LDELKHNPENGPFQTSSFKKSVAFPPISEKSKPIKKEKQATVQTGLKQTTLDDSNLKKRLRGKTLDLTTMGLIPPKRQAKTPGATLKRPFEDIIKSDMHKGRKTTSKKIHAAIKIAPKKKALKKKVSQKVAKPKIPKKKATKTPSKANNPKIPKVLTKKPRKAPVKAARKST
jgi:hypothetical protein